MDTDGRMRLRLAAMMALIYSVQGAFWPVMTLHLADLGVSERGRGLVFATMAMASFAMPLGAGQLVDRFFPTRWFLVGSFGAGAVVLATIALGVATTPAAFFGLFLVYWLFMAPSYSLSNSLAFRNLARPERDFARVRLWGTVGWMAVGWVVSLTMALAGRQMTARRGATEAFWVAAGLSLVTACYCRTLPMTPPLRLVPGGRRTTFVQDIGDLLRRPGVAAYLVAAFGFSLTTPFVYQVIPQYLRRAGMDRAWVASAMSMGQWPEVIGLACLPALIRRWGFRTTLMVGVGSYVVRFASLATEPSLAVATLGIPLHGVGIACFSIAGQMFVNGQAADDRRASAQSMNTVVNGGLGSMIGSLLAGEVLRRLPDRPGLVFAVPAVINLGLVAYLLANFPPARRLDPPPADPGPAADLAAGIPPRPGMPNAATMD